MRTIPAHFYTSQTIATIVKITRTDGQIFRFTSTDKEVVRSGDGTYIPANFISASNLESKVSTGTNNIEVVGGIDSDLILYGDLFPRNKFADATYSIGRIDYENPDDGVIIDQTGRLGDVTITDGDISFSLEMLSLSHLLKQNLGLLTSPTCQCKKLGDAQCKFSLAGNTVNGHASVVSKTITVVNSDIQITFGSETADTGYFDKGIVAFTSGDLNGLEFEIKTHTKSGSTAVLTLRDKMHTLPAVGDTANLTVGCMRRWQEDCVDKFDNGINFHGFPFIPGNDKISEMYRPPR